MHFRSTVAALFTVALCTVTASHTAKNSTKIEIAEPPCFITCAGSAAISVGCTGVSDASCWCTKEQFVIANAQCTLKSCPDLAKNTTLTVASFTALEHICQKAVGNGFNLTIPTAAQISTNATTSVHASVTASASATSAAKAGQKSSALGLQPPMAHIVSACVALSAIVAGSSLLL